MKKLFIITLLNCFIATSSFSQEIGLNIGDKAPALAYKSPNGKNLKLSSLKGKLVLIDFWASWCAPCQNMVPVFSKVAQSSPSLLFAKVNTEQVQQLSADANIRSLPTLVFFHQGKEVDRISGGLNEAQMKQWIMQCVSKVT